MSRELDNDVPLSVPGRHELYDHHWLDPVWCICQAEFGVQLGVIKLPCFRVLFGSILIECLPLLSVFPVGVSRHPICFGS